MCAPRARKRFFAHKAVRSGDKRQSILRYFFFRFATKIGSMKAVAERIRPEFVQGGFEPPSETASPNPNFFFRFQPAIERRAFSYREEAINAVKEIDRKRRGRTVALCYTGGVDSELIALLLHQLGIPFELYFLDLWGINRAPFEEWSGSFTKRIGKKVEVVQVERAFFYESHCPRLFEELGMEFPTYLALPYLFGQIPQDRFIVTGDGDLCRAGPLYEAIAKSYPLVATGMGGQHLPFASSSVALWSWAEARGRLGEYCFFSGTPGLIAATFTHPLFRAARPQNDARRVLLAEFPEIQDRPQSNNWEGRASRENVWIRAWLSRQALRSEKWRNWRSGTGAWVRLDDIFYPEPRA